MLVQNLFYLVCIAVVAEGQTSWPCPVDLDKAPCICTYNQFNYNLNLDCSDVNSDAELTNTVSQSMPFYDYSILKIIKNGIGDPNLNTFSRATFGSCLNLEVIVISGTTLATIEDGALQNSESTLQQLLLPNNQIDSFIFTLLQDFTALEVVDLSSNKISSVPTLVSNYLKTLNLSNNLLHDISSTTFHNLTKLERLYLNGNGLTEAPANMFQGLSLIEIWYSDNEIQKINLNAITSDSDTIVHLDFSNNSITEIEKDAITGLNGAAYVSFANNNIMVLPEDVWIDIFEKVSGLSIDLSGNPLQCGCDLNWLFRGDDSSTYLVHKLTDTTTCYDGYLVKDIDPNIFVSVGCP